MTDKSLKMRVLALTGTYETSKLPPECFTGISGNFDGAGISFGVIQFNLKSGTLQPILKKMIQNHHDKMFEIFGGNLVVIKQMLSKPISEQIKWADSISILPSKRSISQPWRDAFKELGRIHECQIYQMEGCQWYFNRALEYFKKFNFWSERAYALCFDIVVQCGSIGPLVTQRTNEAVALLPKDLSKEELEIEKMKILANKRAEVVKPQFVEDVRSRKLCIAKGSGLVHGLRIDLQAQFDITMKQAIL
jgi:hypothetical protein